MQDGWTFDLSRESIFHRQIGLAENDRNPDLRNDKPFAVHHLRPKLLLDKAVLPR